MAQIKRRIERARQVADYLSEGGHLIKEAAAEFRVSRDTINKDLKLLYNYGYAEELKKNRRLYFKARNAVHNEGLRRKRQEKKG